MAKLYIISGCNGAGKTTASYSLLPEMLECTQFVNSDEFAKGLSPFDPAAAAVSASRFMLMKTHYLLDRKQDFAIETTLATRSLLKLIRKAQDSGYFVTVLYLWLKSPELAVERVRMRVQAGGHNIPDDVVRRRYYMGLKYLFEDYAPASDRWILADNSQVPFTVVAEGQNGRKKELFVRDSDKYSFIKSLVNQ